MSRGKTLLILPILLAIAGYLYWQQFAEIYRNHGRLLVTRQSDAVVLSWHYEIDVPMAIRFSEAFGEWKEKTNKFIIDFKSPGGSLNEGNKVIDLINDIKETHLVETYVGPGNYCASMCVPIFLVGENRVAAATSDWMFHEPTASDFFTGEEVEQPKFEREYYNNRFFDKYFTNSEMDPQWREQLRREWIGKDVWKTGQQLFDEGSNIILELE